MQGSDGGGDGRGIIPRSVEQIFEATQALRAKGWHYTIEASALEIYNENVRDLLVPPQRQAGVAFKVRHAAAQTVVQGATLCPVAAAADIASVLARVGTFPSFRSNCFMHPASQVRRPKCLGVRFADDRCPMRVFRSKQASSARSGAPT